MPLSDDALGVLRHVPLESFGAALARQAMTLTRTPALQAYYRAVGYTRSGLLDGVGQPLPGVERASALTFAESELVLVTLLAAQGGGRNLALHVVFALAAGVPLSKIEHVLLLTGLYAGVEKSSDGLAVLRRTEDLLDELLRPHAHADPPADLAERIVAAVLQG